VKHFPAAAFTRDPTAIKEAARKGPVAITEYRKPRFVVMSFEAWQALEARAKDPRRALRADRMPAKLRKLALEALDRPYER
jgi:PHD/YefM family antitoxin component YafN of YafNO toxin-antitoxin module